MHERCCLSCGCLTQARPRICGLTTRDSFLGWRRRTGRPVDATPVLHRHTRGTRGSLHAAARRRTAVRFLGRRVVGSSPILVRPAGRSVVQGCRHRAARGEDTSVEQVPATTCKRGGLGARCQATQRDRCPWDTQRTMFGRRWPRGWKKSADCGTQSTRYQTSSALGNSCYRAPTRARTTASAQCIPASQRVCSRQRRRHQASGVEVRQVASLPMRMGGLSLRSASRSAEAPYWASWACALPNDQ